MFGFIKTLLYVACVDSYSPRVFLSVYLGVSMFCHLGDFYFSLTVWFPALMGRSRTLELIMLFLKKKSKFRRV